MQQYLVYAWDGTDAHALERRMSARPSHLERARKLKASGNYVMGGALLDEEGKMVGSTMIVQFESKEQLNHWLDDEPYLAQKVWEKVEIHPFRVAEI